MNISLVKFKYTIKFVVENFDIVASDEYNFVCLRLETTFEYLSLVIAGSERVNKCGCTIILLNFKQLTRFIRLFSGEKGCVYERLILMFLSCQNCSCLKLGSRHPYSPCFFERENFVIENKSNIIVSCWRLNWLFWLLWHWLITHL